MNNKVAKLKEELSNDWQSDSEIVASAFDVLAREHDAFIMSESFSLTDLDVWNMIKSCLPENNKLPILDIGSGNGIWSIHLAKLGYKVFCIDISSEMLQIAKRNIDEAGLNNLITVLHADAHNLKALEPNSFSLVLAVGDLLNYSQEPIKILQQLKRVCSPGGKIVASVICRNGILKRLLIEGNLEEIRRLLQTGNWEERSQEEILKKVPDTKEQIFPLRLHTFLPQEMSDLFDEAQIMLKQSLPLGVVPSLLGYEQLTKIIRSIGWETLASIEELLCNDQTFLGTTMEFGIIGEK